MRGTWEKTNTKKRKSISIKIAKLVISTVLVSILVCTFISTESAKNQIGKAVQNNMLTMSEIYMASINEVEQNQDGKAISYDEISDLLEGVQVKGMESSYLYVVDKNGTMLYHPSAEKVGQNVENDIVKGLVEQIQTGKHPEPAVVEYKFNGEAKYASYAITDNDEIIVLSADKSEALSGVERTKKVVGAAGIIMIILSAISATLSSKKIAKPLIKVSEKVHSVANGDLKVEFSDMKYDNDEVGLIVDSIKDMAHSLDVIVEQIRENSDTMAKKSSELNITSEQTLEANNEISKAVEDVAQGSTRMATSITDINDNLTHMSQGTSTIDLSVVDIRTQTIDVKERSANMSDKMVIMQSGSAKMADGIQYITERIQKVNEVVGKVGEIVSVIEQISGQTNLLSLNASIEAARAGDAGRGFAVVADEIRVLSDNTSSELNNIKEIITELVKACEECVEASDTVVEDNKTQQQEIDDVLSEFTSLDEQIELTAAKAEEIKNLVADMVSLNSNITQSSEGLTDVSASNAAASEEVTANIQELNAMMNGVANIANLMYEHSENMAEALTFFK